MADYVRQPELVTTTTLAPRPPVDVGWAPPAGDDGGESGGQRISLGAVLRYKWTFLLITLVIGLPATIGAFLTIKPEYEASAVVQVSPTRPRVLYRTEDESPTYYFHQYINSQMALMRGRTILERTLGNRAVQETDWYRNVEPPLIGKPKTDLERLSEVLSVSQMPGTFHVRIAARAGSAREAALLANTVHDEYLRYVREQVSEGSELILDQLTPEERQLHASIQERERRLADQLLEIRVNSPEELVDTRGKWIEEKRAELLDVQRAVAVYDRQLALLGGHNPATAPAEGESDIVRFRADSQWNSLNQRLEELRLSLADAADRLGPKHPDIETLNRNIASYERQLEAREAFLKELSTTPRMQPRDDEKGDEIVLDPQRLAQVLGQKRVEAQQLEQDINQLEREFARDFKRALDLKLEADALDRDKSKYRLIQQRIDELRTENSLASIRSVGKAAEPSSPANWKKPFMIAGLALGAAAGLGFVAVNWRSMRTPAANDFSRAEQAPVLGTIPAMSRRKLPQPAELMLQEHVRIVRTGLLNRLSAAQRGAVLITSAGPSAGKTTLALMLARSLAQTGRRVLLVDADLYRPSVAARLGIRPPAGLEDVLQGRLTDQEAVMAGDTPNLDLLPIASAGRVKANELFANGVFESSLQRWREHYDFVIMDGCPLLPVADARILLPLVDGSVLVAREGHCRQDELSEALKIVERSGGVLLGTVFVGARSGAGYQYREYY